MPNVFLIAAADQIISQ